MDLLAGVKIAKAMCAVDSDVLPRLERFAATAERSFHKARRELTKAQGLITQSR
jgi:hypothetical protein